MNFYVLTLFPDMIYGSLSHSIIGRAMDEKIIYVECVNIRDYAENKHNRVDDYPYGGGAGMVMQAMPVYKSYLSVKEKAACARVVYMTPQGRKFNQKTAEEFSREDNIILLCGHYEGIDERVIEEIVTDEVSVGDYVLTGGELAAAVVIDAVSRLIPGVLGKDESHQQETFSNSLLEYPQYTRPYEVLGRTVPDILLSGHHKNIEKWRFEQSLQRTISKRPELLEKGDLS